MKLKGTELKGTYKVAFYETYFEVYNDKGNRIYYENSDGKWFKKEYDEKGDEIYYEDSDGEFMDNRVKELTVEEIEKLLGYKIKIKEEKK